MSSNYTRRRLSSVAFKTYGFQTVSLPELQTIVTRLQRPTYSSDLYQGEQYLTHHSTSTPHFICKKAPPPGVEYGPQRRRRRPLNEWEQRRIIARLMKPTISFQIAEETTLAGNRNEEAQKPPLGRPYSVVGATAANNRKEGRKQRPISRSQTADEYNKFLKRIQRPTTATSRRNVCSFSQDPVTTEYLELDYSDDRQVSQEELSTIVDRVSSPTFASDPDKECPRYVSCYRKGTNGIKREPVNSRSQSSMEAIVERLHRPETRSSRSQRTPSATTTKQL